MPAAAVCCQPGHPTERLKSTVPHRYRHREQSGARCHGSDVGLLRLPFTSTSLRVPVHFLPVPPGGVPPHRRDSPFPVTARTPRALGAWAPPDTIAPVITFSAPTSATISASRLTIAASAKDNFIESKMKLYLDGVLKLRHDPEIMRAGNPDQPTPDSDRTASPCREWRNRSRRRDSNHTKGG